MSLVPAFEIDLVNAWIFMCVFLLQWLAVVLIGKRVSQRTGRPPDLPTSKSVRIIGLATMLVWVAATIYSIFLPLRPGTAWFYIGLVVFLAGISVLIAATVKFATTNADRPITTGIYRYSRHPMYLSMFLIYLGVCLASTSWLFCLITIITIILQRSQAKLEESYCLNKFGDTYRNYMNRTPRWLGLPKSG